MSKSILVIKVPTRDMDSKASNKLLRYVFKQFNKSKGIGKFFVVPSNKREYSFEIIPKR